MALKLSAESFLAGVRQSGLVTEPRLDALLPEMQKLGADTTDCNAIAEALVSKKLVTRWQVDKLLQGKFKGFLLGRYRLLELLGRGEMSSIYLAEHVRMKRRCAIKVLPANKVRDTSYLGRFQREAEAVAALDHPNIVRAYDVDMEVEAGAEIHFLVMEYVNGKDLEKLIEEKGQFTPTEAAEYIRQAAEGLAHAHENGLIHRDVKPGNLLVDRKGNVKLLDLGLARFFKDTDMESLTIKHDEKVLGTADYLAPEQAVDSHAVDERADIYSLGCTLYFTLAGTPPFTDGTLVQRLLAHQTKTPPSIKKVRSDVPDSLLKILDKMIAKRKEDRYQTAKEVAQALAAWLHSNAGDDWAVRNPAVVATVEGNASPRRRLKSLGSTEDQHLADISATTAPRLDAPRPLPPLTPTESGVRRRAAERPQPVPTVVPERQSTGKKPAPVAELAPELSLDSLEEAPVDYEQEPQAQPARRLINGSWNWFEQNTLLLMGMIAVAGIVAATIGYTIKANTELDKVPRQPPSGASSIQGGDTN